MESEYELDCDGCGQVITKGWMYPTGEEFEGKPVCEFFCLVCHSTKLDEKYP